MQFPLFEIRAEIPCLIACPSHFLRGLGLQKGVATKLIKTGIYFMGECHKCTEVSTSCKTTEVYHYYTSTKVYHWYHVLITCP